MSVSNIKEALEKKNGKCPTCTVSHPQNGKCNRKDLIFRIENLVRSNAMIPQLMHANKEAVEIANNFQSMAKNFDGAHTILMEILKSHGDKGAQIEKEYIGRLDAWLKGAEHTNQDTCDQAELFPRELLTPPENLTRSSTKQQSGVAFVEGSSNTIPNVIAAEKEPPLSITSEYPRETQSGSGEMGTT